MFRPGIWSREQLSRTPETICGFRIAIAYNLLDAGTMNADDLKAFERTTRAVKLSSGVYRTTYGSRFSDVDTITERLMRAIFTPHQKVVVQDWAASAGLPSVEWAAKIFGSFANATVVASDYYLFLIEATSQANGTYILEPNGAAIQYIKPPFVVPLVGRERSIFLLNRLTIVKARRAIPQLKALAAEIEWRGFPDAHKYSREGWTFRQINLLHPAARKLQSENRRFQIVQHDAFCVLPQPCDVLRVMNFYNPRVWDYDRISSGLKAALDSVARDGLLIVGRTIEDRWNRRNDVSFIRKTAAGPKVVARLGRGFELEELLLSITAEGRFDGSEHSFRPVA